MKNGWSKWSDRFKMAWACLKGESVIFNTRFFISGDLIKITTISPTSQIFIYDNLFVNDSENPSDIRIVIGEDIEENTYG